MIDRLGRAFPVWKRLDSQLRALALAKTQADDEIRRLRAQNEDLSQRLNEALRDGCAARETVTNWIAQYTFGRAVFGPQALPPDDPTDPPIRHRLHGRDVVRMTGPILLREDPNEPGTNPSAA